MANVVWPPTDMGREFDSRRLRKIFSIVRAGDNTNGYYSVPLDASSSSVWRGGGRRSLFQNRRDSTNSKTNTLLVTYHHPLDHSVSADRVV